MISKSVSVVILLVSSLVGLSMPAAAMPPPPEPPPPPPCWDQTRANFAADPSQIDPGQSTTLRWNVIGCAGVTLSMTPPLDGGPPRLQDSRVVWPAGDRSWTLFVRLGSRSKSFTARVTVRQQPVSVLQGLYRGTIHADGGSTADFSLGVTGAPESLTGRLDLGEGGRIVDCFGDHDLGARSGIFLQGQRTGVGADGSTSYSFTGQTTVEGHNVDILVDGASLSPDSTHLSGTARLTVAGCVRLWPFEATRVENRPVPYVLYQTWEEARATLHAAGFESRSFALVDWSCNSIGLIIRQLPGAGTLAVPGSTVRIYVGTEPDICP